MPVSIIIPAHNEREVIKRCLDAITADARPGEFEIVVVCNGCTDNTVEIASGHPYGVRVIDSPVPSKANALNVGDAAATGFPRFYVDADVVLSTDAVRKVAEQLSDGKTHAAAPSMRVNLAGRSWLLRAYFDIWNRLPYCAEQLIGSGVYALSQAGRARFGAFPETMADDNFVRMHFDPAERAAVKGCSFETTPPTTIGGIVKIKARGHVADRRLRQQFPDLYKKGAQGHEMPLLGLAANPLLWPKLAVYVAVKLIVRTRATIKYYSGDVRRWERDDSARAEQAPAGA